MAHFSFTKPSNTKTTSQKRKKKKDKTKEEEKQNERHEEAAGDMLAFVGRQNTLRGVMQRNYSSVVVHVNVGSAELKGPGKKKTEDAFFISSDKTTFGVADGVGGWASSGVDVSLFSSALMRGCKQKAETSPDEKLEEYLKAGVKEVGNMLGSSTASLARIRPFPSSLTSSDPPLLLDVLNYGDSGLLVVRAGRALYKTPEMQLQFNMPFQLEAHSSTSGSMVSVVGLLPSDIVVVGTDGLFDNLYDDQVAEVVELVRRRTNDPSLIAELLMKEASHAASLPDSYSPFATRYLAAGGKEDYRGGKPDDITVLVALLS